MKTKHIATREEIEAIKEVITDILQLWAFDLIEANDGEGRSIGMSKKTFFEQLERQLS